MGHHGDPAKMIERLDADNNGTVELAELPPHMRERLAKADADGDLRLTADELNAHHEQMKKQHFAAKDTNQDGALSADEVGKRWTHMSVADADKDGRITQAELDAAHAEGKLRPHGKAGGHHKLDPEAFLKRFDANANGTLELGELPEHKREKLGAADANKDQQITAEELKMFFEQRRMQRGAPTGAAPAAEPSTR
jgi:Ca2+-binding EF-hand superfamily protein